MNIQDETRQMVINYLHDNKVSVNQLSKQTGILQPNLHVFINGKGLSIKSLEKLWRFFGMKLVKSKNLIFEKMK